jgi:hypothetical protein
MKSNKYHLFLDETGDHGLSFIDKNFPLFLRAKAKLNRAL